MNDDFAVVNNPTVQLPPSLIAGVGYKNALFDPVSCSTWIIDGYRLGFSFRNLQEVIDSLELWMGLHYVSSYTSNRIGRYKFVWSWDKADAIGTGLKEDDGTEGVTIAAGCGLIDGGSKIVNKGFIDFNPQKVNVKKARSMVDMLSALGCDVWVQRYDVAVDFPVNRDSVRVLKDRRKYECVISNGMTEYLGQRSNPGRVKVYDKQAESDLDFPLTRVELTCSGDWSIQKVIEMLPVVYSFDSMQFNNLKGVTKAFAVMLSELIRVTDSEGDKVIEPYLRLVDKRTRKKVKDAIVSDAMLFKYDVNCLDRLMSQLGEWVR